MMYRIKDRLQISDRIIPNSYWEETVSGKVLELRVRPSLDKNPGNYRLGVIQIGRVIAKIQLLEKAADTSPQIQLFPNLVENQLAATIYWPELLTFAKPDVDTSPGVEVVSEEKLIKIAHQFNFSIQHQDVSSDSSDSNTILGVLSSSNQPFIWLKVGQMVQQLIERFGPSFKVGSLNIKIIPFGNYQVHEKLNTRMCCQVKLYLQNGK